MLLAKSDASRRGEENAEHVPKQRLVEIAIEFIRNGIRDGEYVPGQHLVEKTIARDAGLRIGPVREALRLLAGEGLLEVQPYRGARVRHLTRSDLIERLHVARGLFEVGVRHLLELPKSKRGIQTLRKIVREINESENSHIPVRILQSTTRYHLTLVNLSKNKFLLQLYERLHLELFDREIAANIRIDDWRAFIADYERITDAIGAGDKVRALAECDSHFARVLGSFISE